MAKYVVLSFKDNDDADEYVQELTKSFEHSLAAEVVGVFQQPTQFCTCQGTKGRISAWTKGLKYGWWVCKRCKKPAEATAGPVHQMRMVVGQGTNLLEIEGDKPAEVTDKGWGVFGRDPQFTEQHDVREVPVASD